MNKIFPMLVVSILVLSGLGVVASTDDENPSTLGGLEAEVRGGKGVTVTITNNGDTPYQEQGTVTIFILFHLRHIYVSGKAVSYLPTPIPIPAQGGSVSVSKDPIIAFGLLGKVLVKIDIDGDGNVDAEGSKHAFVFGPLVIMKNLLITIP